MPRPRRDGKPPASANKRKLTEIFVRKLDPRAATFRVWDTIQRGLVVSVQPTGAKSWKAIYSISGRPRWFHIGKTDAIGLAAARKLAGKVMFEVAEGKDPSATRKAARSAGTFEELADRYLAHAKKKNRSWKQADALVPKHLRPRWGKLRAADVTRSDVRAMVARITSPSVANQVLAAASAIFAWAIKEEFGGVAVNPCKGVSRNATASRERVLSDGEIPKFWQAFDDAGLVRGSALKMILLTGQRPGEVRHLHHEHLVDGWWTMPGAPDKVTGWSGTKNGETHRVWLPPPAVALLSDLNHSGFVFSAAGGRPIGGLDGAMRAICAALKIERVTPHDLRRTHGTTVAALGFGRDAMNRIQNHKEGGIASVYDRHPEVILTVEEAIETLGISRSVIGAMLRTLPDVPPTTSTAVVPASALPV